MDRDHVFNDHGYAEPSAGLGARAARAVIHARLTWNVDSRRASGILAGRKGTHNFL